MLVYFDIGLWALILVLLVTHLENNVFGLGIELCRLGWFRDRKIHVMLQFSLGCIRHTPVGQTNNEYLYLVLN